jgi:hypothetical protein
MSHIWHQGNLFVFDLANIDKASATVVFAAGRMYAAGGYLGSKMEIPVEGKKRDSGSILSFTICFDVSGCA